VVSLTRNNGAVSVPTSVTFQPARWAQRLPLVPVRFRL